MRGIRALAVIGLCCRSRGLGLVELLMALSLGLGLGAAVVRQYLNTLQIQELQTHLAQTQRNSAYARFLLSQAIHASFATRCASTVSQGNDGSIRSWIAGDVPEPPYNALTGTAVLSLRAGECDAQLAEIFYLSRRAGHADNPIALFRRRQRSDGTYANAEEIVEGVSELQIRLVAELAGDDLKPPHYMYMDQRTVGEVVMVQISMTFEMSDSLAILWPGGSAQNFEFSVASRNLAGR